MGLTRPKITSFVSSGQAGGDVRFNGKELNVTPPSSNIFRGLNTLLYDETKGELSFLLSDGDTVTIKGFLNNTNIKYGPEGPAGVSGRPGTRGVNGPAGLRGKWGPQGPIGTPGVKGVKGMTGAAGPKGVLGPEGSRGLQGYDGILKYITGDIEDPGAVGAGVLWLFERIPLDKTVGPKTYGTNLDNPPSIAGVPIQPVVTETPLTGGNTGGNTNSGAGGGTTLPPTTSTTGLPGSDSTPVSQIATANTQIIWPYVLNDIIGFGSTVNVAKDTKSVFVTAPLLNTSGYIDLGEAYRYINTSGTLALQDTFTPSGLEKVDGLNYSSMDSAYSISADSSIIAVGDKQYSEAGNTIGKVDVYKYDTNTSSYTLLQSLNHPSATARFFGSKVSISGDGTTIVVATADGGVNEDPVVFVLDTVSGQYVYLQELFFDVTDGIVFFNIDYTASRIAVAKNRNTGDTARVLRIFSKSGNTYSLETELIVHGNTSNTIGHSMVFNKSGTKLFLGTTFSPSTTHTAVYVYSIDNNNVWSLFREIKHTVVQGTSLGYQRLIYVDTDDTGNRLVISHNESTTDIANVYVFDWDTNYDTYIPQYSVLPSGDIDSNTYYSLAKVSLSGDGTLLAIGCPSKYGAPQAGNRYKTGVVFIHTLT